MRVLVAQCLLFLASTVAAVPAAAAKSKSPCQKSYTHYIAHFDDLQLDQNGQTHAVKGPGGGSTYMNLSWSQYCWQVVSAGNQTIQNDFEADNFEMTTHSGQGALVNVNAGDISQNRIAHVYNGEYFAVNSFWVRGQYADAFTLSLTCTSYPRGESNYVVQKATFNIPQVPYGQYTKVALTKAQKNKFTWLTECYLGDNTQGAYEQHVLLDDFDFCFYSG